MPAFIFDIDDTMYDRLTPFRLAFEQQFGRREEGALRSLFGAFIRRGNEVFEDAMSQRITMEDMYVFRIRQAMADSGWTITPKEALEFQAAYGWQQRHIQLSAPLKEMLDCCVRAGAFLGVITNGPSGHQRQKFHSLGLERWIREDHLLASGDIGINKPDPAIFHAARERWQLIPGKIWYIGDSYEHDITGAANAGWHTIWLNRTGEKERRNGPPDFTAATEEELKDRVSALLYL